MSLPLHYFVIQYSEEKSIELLTNNHSFYFVAAGIFKGEAFKNVNLFQQLGQSLYVSFCFYFKPKNSV